MVTGDLVTSAVRVRTKVQGGPWFVELGLGEKPSVCLGPYDNPALARDEAKGIVAFLRDLLAAAESASCVPR